MFARALRRLLSALALAAWASVSAATGAAEGDAPRVAVLPIESLTEGIPDLAALRESLEGALIERGVALADPAAVDDALARRRVRFTGGLDHGEGLALRDLVGAATFLTTAIELHDPEDPPRFCVTARLLTVDEETIRPVWAGSYHLAGDDSPGALGLHLVADVQVLEERAVAELADAVSAAALQGTGRRDEAWRPDGERRFRPRSLFVKPGAPGATDGPRRVVVLPFRNQSPNPHAGEIVQLEFIGELVRSGRFDVVERGVTRKALLDLRIIQEGGISLAQADLLRALLDADLVVTGTVFDWRDGRPNIPTLVEFTAYAVNTRDKRVEWLARDRALGTEGAWFFGLREVRTAPGLASGLVRSLLEVLDSKFRKESRAPSP